MKRIVVLATGGTIASRYSDGHGAVVATATGDDLVSGLGALDLPVQVTSEQICNIGSFRFTLPLAFEIVQRISALVAEPDVAGVVVTCGTDTMEEIAYLSDILVHSDKPVVFTGAQRHAGIADSDGPRNLRTALLVASAAAAHSLGTMIVFEDEIHAARDVTKTHASRVGTFASWEHGKLGEVDMDRVIITRRPIRRPPLETSAIEDRVELVKLYMGCDGRFIDYTVETGGRGIVVEAFGRGNATPSVVEAIRKAIRAGLVAVVATRSPMGRVSPIYGDGGGHDLMQAGAIFAGDLSSVKARILLAVLLGSGASQERIQQEIVDRGF